MAYKIVFAPEARDDLKRLYLFVAERAGERIALAYLERIEIAAASKTFHTEALNETISFLVSASSASSIEFQ